MNPRPADLPALWRERAELLRPYAPQVARAFEDAAEALESSLLAAEGDLLDLRAAAAESGYSTDHLARLLRDGKLRNAGRSRSPRIRRADLPRKVGRVDNAPPRGDVLGASPRQIAAAVIQRPARGG